MALVLKMRASEIAQGGGSHRPAEHYIEDHWFTSMSAGKGQPKDCCEMVEKGQSSEKVTLRAVYSLEPGHPNHEFWDATPLGELVFTIHNPAAFGYIEPGEEYFVEIRKARS